MYATARDIISLSVCRSNTQRAEAITDIYPSRVSLGEWRMLAVVARMSPTGKAFWIETWEYFITPRASLAVICSECCEKGEDRQIT